MQENNQDRTEIYSQKIKAGKRTYFFDVKSTRANDYYMTVTESKKRFHDGGFVYEKHKIFLYKEDFIKFVQALTETVDHIKNELMPGFDFEQFALEREESYNNYRLEQESLQNADQNADQNAEQSQEQNAPATNSANVSVKSETISEDDNSELKWE